VVLSELRTETEEYCDSTEMAQRSNCVCWWTGCSDVYRWWPWQSHANY